MDRLEDTVLEVEGLTIETTDGHNRKVLVSDVAFSLRRGAITAIVGETGSGKTLTALSLLRLLPDAVVRTGGTAMYDGRDVFALDDGALRRLRGHELAIVFQDARSALNPVLSVGRQLVDALRAHREVSTRQAKGLCIEMLDRVRIPDPSRRMKQYPHEFSGGMAQRVMLALALVCSPKLLILDEPTTGLDVTIQADIMDLIVRLVREDGMSACLITHDMGIVAESCDDIVVMRSGVVRETGSCEQIFRAPADAYTRMLLEASRSSEFGS